MQNGLDDEMVSTEHDMTKLILVKNELGATCLEVKLVRQTDIKIKLEKLIFF